MSDPYYCSDKEADEALRVLKEHLKIYVLMTCEDLQCTPISLLMQTQAVIQHELSNLDPKVAKELAGHVAELVDPSTSDRRRSELEDVRLDCAKRLFKAADLAVMEVGGTA